MGRYLIFVLLSLSSLYIRAQEVLETNDTIAFSVDMGDLVITGQYKPTHYKNVIHNVSVISQEAIQRRGATPGRGLPLRKCLSLRR